MHCAAAGSCTLRCADEVAETIEQEGPETVAMVIMEPVQNSGGTFTPHPDYHRRIREICDEYGVLQVADEVICGFGRLGEWFGVAAVRLRARHHHVREGPHDRPTRRWARC